MNNYKTQGGYVTGSVGTQVAAKQVTELVAVSKLSFNTELTYKTVEEMDRYAKQVLCRHKLSSRSVTRTWKPVTKEETYVILGLFMLMDIIQKCTLR
jgi:hypothetical protein